MFQGRSRAKRDEKRREAEKSHWFAPKKPADDRSDPGERDPRAAERRSAADLADTLSRGFGDVDAGDGWRSVEPPRGAPAPSAIDLRMAAGARASEHAPLSPKAPKSQTKSARAAKAEPSDPRPRPDPRASRPPEPRAPKPAAPHSPPPRADAPETARARPKPAQSDPLPPDVAAAAERADDMKARERRETERREAEEAAPGARPRRGRMSETNRGLRMILVAAVMIVLISWGSTLGLQYLRFMKVQALVGADQDALRVMCAVDPPKEGDFGWINICETVAKGGAAEPTDKPAR